MAFWIFLEVLQYITIPYYLFILKLRLANKKNEKKKKKKECKNEGKGYL